MVKKIILGLVVCLALGAGVASAKKAAPANLRYDKELAMAGLLFSPPAGWEKVVLETKMAAVFYIRKDKKANCAVRFPERATAVSFSRALDSMKATRKPVSEEKTVLLGVPCFVLTFEKKDQAGAMMKTREYHFFKKGWVYGLVFTSDEKGFGEYLPEFEASLGTMDVR